MVFQKKTIPKLDVFVKDVSFRCVWSCLQFYMLEIDHQMMDMIHLLNLQLYRRGSDTYTPEFNINLKLPSRTYHFTWYPMCHIHPYSPAGPSKLPTSVNTDDSKMMLFVGVTQWDTRNGHKARPFGEAGDRFFLFFGMLWRNFRK